MYPEGIVCYDKHLTRLQEGAHALGYEETYHQKMKLKGNKGTLDANGMDNDTHIRLTLTSGRNLRGWTLDLTKVDVVWVF